MLRLARGIYLGGMNKAFVSKLSVSVAAFAVLTTGFAGVAAAQDEIDGLRVTRAERQKLVFTWERQSGADGYEVLIDGTVAGEVSSNWFVASGLQVESDYDVQVRASDGTVSDVESFSTADARRGDWPRELRNVSWWRNARQIRFLGLAAPTRISRDGVVIAEAAMGTFVDRDVSPETTYDYEFQLVTGDEADDRFVRTASLSTVAVLEPVTGVTARLIEPGIAEVSWDALDADGPLAYRVYVNDALVSAPQLGVADGTTRRVAVPFGQTSTVRVAAFNGGGGPLSDRASVTSTPDDPAQIGLELVSGWAGTMVLRWNRTDAVETVLFDGVEVAEGRYGWATIRDLPYNQTYAVSIVSSNGESVTYDLTSFSIELGEVRGLEVRESSLTSLTIDSIDFRSQLDRSFEIQRDGVVVGVIDPDTAGARTFVDRGLKAGTNYVYTVTEFADGALGVAAPTSITATTDGTLAGETPPAPEAIVSFVDRGRAVLKVTTAAEGELRQVHTYIVIRRNGMVVADVAVRPKWEQFTYFTDLTIDRSEAATYEVTSVSSTGFASAPTVIVVPALG